MSASSPKSKQRRWRIQFSLGMLFVVITLLGVWLGIQVNRANRQRRAIEAIKQAEGLFRYDYQESGNDEQGRPIAVGEPPGNKWLRQVLGDDYFSPVVVVDFATGFYGRRKELGLSKIDDDGLRCMEALPDVEALELGHNRAVTDAGLVHLRNCRKLRALYLYDTGISGTGCEHLTGLPELSALMLDESPLTDEGLQEVGRLRNLSSLTLSDTPITDVGVAHLKSLTKLRRLDLDNTQVTDAGLVHLEGLSLLESLLLPEAISDEALAKLQRELPKCRVMRARPMPP